MNPRTLPLLVLLAALVAAGRLTAADSAAPKPRVPNLLSNGSFENATGDKPTGWQTATWGGKGSFTYADQGRTGKRSVVLSSDSGADIGWQVTVPVELNAVYRLSGWIKTENVRRGKARGALLNVHNIQSVATGAVTGTRDWTRVEVTFETAAQDAVQINCLLGGWGLATGKAWFDDLRLEKIGGGESWEPRIAIDAGKIGEPVSKYIYGQFIEHLGRCIYGGIWAEMLEDRKFFLPVGDKQSPWKPLGEPTGVSMDTGNPFVGRHTPKITAPGGIVQEGLGLMKGKQYVGRIWFSGAEKAAPVKVSLIWGDGPGDRQTIAIEKLGDQYAKTPLKFTAGADTDNARLEIASAGSGEFRVGTVSLMPADNVQGMRADTLEVLEQLDSPVYRWPGGNFVSGYDWKDALGDVDRRPPRKNPAWQGIEHNDFGIDEFMTFCRILGTEPYIAVNSGLGDVKMATDEVEYCNGAAETPMGKLRAENGHPEPYKVRWWSIGNEMYGNWQLGHIPLEKYAQKHNQFAEAMRKVDPSIKLIAVGDAGPWSIGMMTHCADQMDLISEHFYRNAQPGLAGHVAQIPAAVRQKAEAHRAYRQKLESLRGKDIRIALDEWNFWYGEHLYGELGTRYFLKDALGIAAGLNEYARQSDIIFMANYAQTVNVIGAIKTSKTAAAFETTGLALVLYRKHFGTLPVAVTTAPPLDVAAAWTPDRKALTIAIVNPTMRKLDIALTLQGAAITGAGKRWQIAGNDPMLYNEPGKAPKVTVAESAVRDITDKLPVAACSVTLYALEVK